MLSIMFLDMIFHGNLAYINKANIIRIRSLTVKNYIKN